jgi:hypothetical protein
MDTTSIRQKESFDFRHQLKHILKDAQVGVCMNTKRHLGVKLKIKSVDVSPLNENIANPVVFTFEIVD